MIRRRTWFAVGAGRFGPRGGRLDGLGGDASRAASRTRAAGGTVARGGMANGGSSTRGARSSGGAAPRVPRVRHETPTPLCTPVFSA